jgi:hypothetical protein
MKALLRLGFMGVVTIAVVTNAAFAQRARQPAEGNMLQGDINRPRQSVQGNMPQGDINRPPRPAPMRPHPSRPFAAPIFPLGFGGYGFGGYDYGSIPQATSVVVVQPPPPVYAPVPERPPETATMVIHEYPPLSPVATQPPQADQPMFAIVLKNSTILSASAVIVQEGALHIVDPDGGHQRVSLDAVDRAATRRANQERKLQLQLPPPAR